MSGAAHNPDDYCYRHPDRPSFVLCERCARTICLECQIPVEGHVFCPDDAKAEQVKLAPVSNINQKPKKKRQRSRQVAGLLDRVSPSTPIVTYSLLAVLVILFLVDVFFRGVIQSRLLVAPTSLTQTYDVLHQPWSLLTSMFLPGGILTLLFSGYAIFVFGRHLERFFGRGKFFALYLISGFGASVFAFLLDGVVASAFGAIYGLIAATVILARRMGGNQTILYVTCAISVVLGLVLGGWQACVGGLLAGALTAFVYFFEGNAEQARRMRLLLVGIAGLLLVLAVVRAFAFQG